MTLTDLVARDPEVARVVQDLSISNREVGRRYGYNESVIRRYRQKMLTSPNPVRVFPVKHVQGTAQWTPGVDLSENSGEIRTLPVPSGTPIPTDQEILIEAGVDPAKWEVTNRYESKWQSANSDWKTTRKLTLRPRKVRETLTEAQVQEILGFYRDRPSFARPAFTDRIFVFPIGDLQAGKIDGGGTAALIDRFASIVTEAKNRLMYAGGARLLLLPVLGDCIEGIVFQGGKLATRLDISVTEQVRVYRRLLMHAIMELSPYAKDVIVPVLPGNHDENYRLLDQPVTDSWAIEGASAVQDALVMSGEYKKGQFVYPKDEELVITLNVGTEDSPFIIGMTHGHLAKTASGFTAWWGKQSFGRQHGGNADLMLSGHFHHLRVEQAGGGRSWIQIPAMDGGSDYYRRQSGDSPKTGMVSFWVTPGKGIGWEGLVVHTG
jgi:hypothetical protein